MKKQKAITQIIIIIAIIAFVNLIFYQVYFRLDFTADKRYTLSDATKDLLENVNDVVTITAYFSENLPPQLQSHRQDFIDLLIEYENRSGGDIVYRLENPNESEQKMQEVQQEGIQPVPVNVTEKDQVKQMLAFMGAVLQQGEETEVISFLQPNSNIEYALTRALRKLIIKDKPPVAFIQGHGEPSLQEMQQLRAQLSAMYDVQAYEMTDTAVLPSYYKSIVIVNPTDTFPQSHLNQLDNYLNQGGGLLLAYNSLQPNFNQGFLSTAPDIGLKGWLAEKGLALEDQYVIDVNCATVGVMQQMGNMQFQRMIQLPLFPIISNFSGHPVVTNLESVVLQVASPVKITNPDSAVNITPLAFTSSQSGTLPPNQMLDLNRDWQESDFPQSQILVAVAAEGPLAGKGDARMVLATSGDFIVSGGGQEARQVNEDNINFASNSIDWLSDDTGLIDLRTRMITARFLDPVDDSTRQLLKWGNVLAPVVLVLLIGLVRRQQYLRKKQQWMQNKY